MRTRKRVVSSSGISEKKINWILDSGAFSAWKSGNPVNLKDYIEFIKTNEDWVSSYVALDVINQHDTNASARESFDNLKIMRKAGLDPIPVFHVGESIDWLYRMLDLGCDYIGLSASSIVAKGSVDDWYALVWSHLVDSNGLPVVKTHAFGEGKVSSLTTFPFYSCDSTSWIWQSERNGLLKINARTRLCHRNDGKGNRNMPDIDQLSPIERQALDDALREYNVDPRLFEQRGTKATAGARLVVAAKTYAKISEEVNRLTPIRFNSGGFFIDKRIEHREPVHIPEMKLHLVCGSSPRVWVPFYLSGHRHALISYFYARDNARLHNRVRAFTEDPEKAIHAEPYLLEALKELRGENLS